VHRDRRFRALGARRATDALPWARPHRRQHRRNAAPRRDHHDRLRPRPPAARRGSLALPRTAAHRPRSTPAKTARARSRSRSPGAPSSACTAAGNGSSSAPSAARSSPSPPASSPASAGRSPPAPSSRPTPDPVGWDGGGPARARETRDRPMSNPASHRGTPRRILDSGTPRRNPGPAAIGNNGGWTRSLRLGRRIGCLRRVRRRAGSGEGAGSCHRGYPDSTAPATPQMPTAPPTRGAVEQHLQALRGGADRG
jgi:hypothetical protein